MPALIEPFCVQRSPHCLIDSTSLPSQSFNAKLAPWYILKTVICIHISFPSLYKLVFMQIGTLGDFLVPSHVQFPPPPSEVTKQVGCYLPASSVFPRTYLGAPLLLPVLRPRPAPLPDPTRSQLTVFSFPLEFRLQRFPGVQASCSLLLSFQIGSPSIHSTPLPPHLHPLSALGLALCSSLSPGSWASQWNTGRTSPC